MTRYGFDEVRSALHKHWGLSLRRGGDMTDMGRDGRWDTAYSKTGYVVGGDLPRRGHGYQRFRSLGAVVRAWDLAKVVAKGCRRG
jgi:hypothetical protein